MWFLFALSQAETLAPGQNFLRMISIVYSFVVLLSLEIGFRFGFVSLVGLGFKIWLLEKTYLWHASRCEQDRMMDMERSSILQFCYSKKSFWTKGPSFNEKGFFPDYKIERIGHFFQFRMMATLQSLNFAIENRNTNI